ncbi:MAG TPA: class I SAM-dependent methyltransferase [Roseiarcus sp.]|jgi:SAM-dependent methyltransferase
MNDLGSPDQQAFRDFVYGNYETTHHVYGVADVAATPGRRRQIAAALRKWLPADRAARILDFGCGDGTLLSIAEGLGYTQLHGVDVSSGLAALARKATRAQVVSGDGFEYLRRAAPLSFDAIVAFDVLEHLTKPELAAWAREAHRVLAPGGVVLLHVPNGCSPFVGRVLSGDLTHERAFTANSLGQLLRPIGFVDGAAYEDPPQPHGLKSFVRTLLWQVIRVTAVGWLAIETGVARGHVLTINLFYVARKAAAPMAAPSISVARAPATAN